MFSLPWVQRYRKYLESFFIIRRWPFRAFVTGSNRHTTADDEWQLSNWNNATQSSALVGKSIVEAIAIIAYLNVASAHIGNVGLGKFHPTQTVMISSNQFSYNNTCEKCDIQNT